MRFNVFAIFVAAAATAVPALAWDDARYVSREAALDVLRRLDAGYPAMRGPAVESPPSLRRRRRSEYEYVGVAGRDLERYQRRAPSFHVSRDHVLDLILREVDAREMEARSLVTTIKNAVTSCLSGGCVSQDVVNPLTSAELGSTGDVASRVSGMAFGSDPDPNGKGKAKQT